MEFQWILECKIERWTDAALILVLCDETESIATKGKLVFS